MEVLKKNIMLVNQIQKNMYASGVRFSFLAIASILMLLHFSCKKESDNNNPSIGSGITITTEKAKSITITSAIIDGNISSDGGSAITLRGICWSVKSNPDTSGFKTKEGNGQGVFSSILNNLSANTKYYARAYALNSKGLAYGSEISFTSSDVPSNRITFSIPTIIPITGLLGDTQTISVTILSDGGSPDTSRGVCIGTTNSPDTSKKLIRKIKGGSIGIGTFSMKFANLAVNTTYYVRPYAINANGLSYGTEWSFVLPFFINGDGVIDIDGNNYNTIILNRYTSSGPNRKKGPEWMKTNLKTTRYQNGSLIATDLDNTSWSKDTSGAFSIYNNVSSNNNTYGKLYNFYAVANPLGLCPVGWRIPSDAEWTTLENFLGGKNIAGGLLKAVSGLWASPNKGAQNLSGISALPGGNRNDAGNFNVNGNYGYWWTSTKKNSSEALYRSVDYNNINSYTDETKKQNGFSIRCIKD